MYRVTIHIRSDDIIRPNTKTLFGTEANTKRIFGTFLTTNQPNTKSNRNAITKQHAVINTQLNVVLYPMCPET